MKFLKFNITKQILQKINEIELIVVEAKAETTSKSSFFIENPKLVFINFEKR